MSHICVWKMNSNHRTLAELMTERLYNEGSLCPLHKDFWYSRASFFWLCMSLVIHLIFFPLALCVCVFECVCPCVLMSLWITRTCLYLHVSVRVAVRSYMWFTRGWHRWISSANVILKPSREERMRGWRDEEKWGKKRQGGLMRVERNGGWWEEERVEGDEMRQTDSKW